MKKNRPVLLPLLIVLLALTMACSLLDQLIPTQAPVPTEELAPPMEEPTLPAPEPTAAEEPTPTTPPTETPPNHGQIVYVSEGNIWRYIVDTGEMTQLTFDGVADSYENSYGNPLFSADGHYASYGRNGVSYLHNLEDNSVTSLPIRIFQWSPTQPASFYAGSGTFECPAMEDLEDQSEMNFDILRYDVAAIDTPVLIANVAGGLFFPQAISNDEQYASILHCACYSECGGQVIHHLPSNTTLSAPPDVYPGTVDFSPDSSRLVTSNQQIYGYTESSLYLGNIDFSAAIPLFSEPNVAVYGPHWSPEGGWIAFVALDIGSEFDITNSRVMIINLDGTVQLEIATGYADFSDWSPDGSQILFRNGMDSGHSPFIYDLLSGSTTALPFTVSREEMDWGVLP